MKLKYREKKLFYTNTDSFIAYIKTEDIYLDLPNSQSHIVELKLLD